MVESLIQRRLIEQLSVVPPSTSKMVKLPVPLLSRFTTGDFNDITGARVSSINTFPVSLDTLPLLSVTVMMICSSLPALLQKKSVLSTVMLAIPQLSEEFAPA